MASRPNMFCTDCGNKLLPTHKFCSSCGSKVDNDQDPGEQDVGVGSGFPPNPGGNFSVQTPCPTQQQPNQPLGTLGPHGALSSGQQLPQYTPEQIQWFLNVAMRFPQPGAPIPPVQQTSQPAQHEVVNEVTSKRETHAASGRRDPAVTGGSEETARAVSTPQRHVPTEASDQSKQIFQFSQNNVEDRGDQKRGNQQFSDFKEKNGEDLSQRSNKEDVPPTPLPPGESTLQKSEQKDSEDSTEQLPPLEEASQSSEDSDEQNTKSTPKAKSSSENVAKQTTNIGTKSEKSKAEETVAEKPERLKEVDTKHNTNSYQEEPKDPNYSKTRYDSNNDNTKKKEQQRDTNPTHPLNAELEGDGKDVTLEQRSADVTTSVREKTGKDVTQKHPPGQAYNKSKTEPQDYVSAQAKEKKKKKKKEKSSQDADYFGFHGGEGNQIPQPSGFKITQGQGVLVHFHTIISADFNFKQGRDKVVVRMGGDEFGHWKYNCLEMEVERELPGQFSILQGSVLMRPSLVNKKMIPYKYVVYKQDSDTVLYEYIHKEHDTWNRCLRVKDCSNGGTWHQYDDTMQIEHPKEGVLKKMTSAAYSTLRSYIPFVSKESKPEAGSEEVDRLVYGRQLAMLNYLPRWEGFVTPRVSEKMTPLAALKQTQQVCETIMNARVTIRGYANYAWSPRGFSGKSLLSDYLAEKLDSFSQGSSSDSGTEDNATRIVSALAITVIVSQYDVPLSTTQWSSLLEGLRFPVVSRAASNSLLKSVTETLSSVLKDVTESLVNLCQKCFSLSTSGRHEWLFALPILHFLRGDSTPYNAPADGPKTRRKWWGVSGLGIDNLQIPSMSDRQLTPWLAFLDQLLPLFELDHMLPRSSMYLQLSLGGLTQMVKSSRFSSGLLCCAAHVVIWQKRYISIDESKHLAEDLRYLSRKVKNINHSQSEHKLSINQCYDLVESSCNVVTVIFEKQRGKTMFELVLEGCSLFGASYQAFLNACTITTRSQEQLIRGAYQMAQGVLQLVLEWLHKEMPRRVTFDGKRLEFVNEFDIWNQLLGIEFSGTFVTTWKQQLIDLLKARVKQISDDNAKVELFCNFDTPTIHADLSQVLSDSAFSGLDHLVQERGENKNMLNKWLQSSTKFGSLLSRVFVKAWPTKNDDQVILQHILNWTPLVNFVKITVDEKTAYGDIFSEEAQTRLVEAKSLFEDVCKKVVDGSILIRELKLITESRCSKQFDELYRALQIPTTGLGGEKTDSRFNITDLLKARRREVRALTDQMHFNDCLLKMCKTIDPVDCKELEAKLHTNIDARQLTEVCTPISPVILLKTGLPKLNITFFMHPPTVTNMLQPLMNIQDSYVFNNLWRRQAIKVRRNHKSNVLSLEEVAELIWHPVYDDQLQETSTKLSTGLISLGEVDLHFKGLYRRQRTMLEREVTKVMGVEEEADPAVVWERLGQIEDYYRYQEQSDVAGEILKVKEAFGLTGDFTPMETLYKVSSDEFKKKPLSSISRKVVSAAEELKTVGLKERSCLKELSKCQELINWIRKEIQDEKQLRVFVELAGNNAGETAMEVDRVLCFHRAATGYASFIFDLKDVAGYLDLIRVCKKVWKALENDPGLPALLVDTQKELPWLRQVKESQGDIETSSLIQAEAINTRGVYTIGKIDTIENRETKTALQLKVTAEDQGENTEESRDRDRVYSASGLKDLQSRLTLVAGKAKDLRAGQADIEYFVEIFTAAQQLAESYTRLTQAGNILFSEWRALLYCGYQDGISVHVNFGIGQSGLLAGFNPLTRELRFLREFMTTCLTEWYQYVEDRRSEYYELNYFTTEQLVLLRQSLAYFAKQKRDLHLNEESNDLPPQVYVLLSSIKHHCNRNDVESAIRAAAKDILKPPMDEATIAEQAEAEKEAAKLEALKAVVHELKEEFEIDENLAWASIQALGQEMSVDEYMAWCVENISNEALIEDLTSSLKIPDEQGPEEDDEEALYGFLSQTKTFKEVASDLLQDIVHKRRVKSLKKQLTQLWHDYLHSMKSTDVEDCLSLEHLGLILQHLARAGANENHPPRGFPTSLLKEDQPNLIVRQTCDVLKTVLSIYMHDGGKLPTTNEVLVCSASTTLEEVTLLWRRAVKDSQGRVFCLVRADLLDYDISVKAEQQLSELMRGRMEYRIVVVCSSEKEDSSHIVTALDQYRREMPANPCSESLRRYLENQFRVQAEYIEIDGGIPPAAVLTRHRCSVEAIVSSRPGVGKSLVILRYAEDLSNNVGKSRNEVCVTVPLQHTTVDQDAVVKALLPHQTTSYSTLPHIFHIDVAPMVREGLDHLLFNLLILGGLCDSHGQVWRCKPQDLYVVEITDITLQHMIKEPAKSTHTPFYALLPSVMCRAPQANLTACKWQQQHGTLPQEWQNSDPTVDDQEFRSPAFQRTYQYLTRFTTGANLDVFNFKGTAEGKHEDFLITLLNHCGVENPSWAELRHFAHFLSIQLDDCQNSVFCDPIFHDAESGLQGFKTFVVRFMIQMAMDFATPSLNMSEESPSRAVLHGLQETSETSQQEDLPVELGAFQLRRRWESSPHPYIFFNCDRVSMTFMGFYIDKKGSLIDPTTQGLIEANIMSPKLRQGLELQRVELSKDFDSLPRLDRLHRLCMVLGAESSVMDVLCNEDADPDNTYELTTDNVKKMLAIHMRFRCGIPVVIMGETGCGKTRLIRFLCQLQARIVARDANLNNMILMKVHGGTSSNDILKKVERAQEIADMNKRKHGVDTVLFFDEANTTEAIGLIKEIMCDGRAQGQHIDMANGALKIVAACNPYRRHTEAMIERLKTAGLGYHVAAEDTYERLGAIPLRELVYRVHALPPSMLPLVWDFGQLNADIEAKYIRQIVQRYVNSKRLLANSTQAQVITNVLAASQQFMRDQENECSFVSLRDVERCLEVLAWFNDHMNLLRPLLDERARREREEEEEKDVGQTQPLDNLTSSLVLAIGVCYHACLQEGRDNYRDKVARHFQRPCYLPDGDDQILEEITRCQDVFLDQVKLDDNIARNAALKENVFMMVVCIELRIPLFLVGKPGSSKSLAKTIVADAMQGESARSSELFKNLKQVHMTSFQCSPLSTPDGIVGTFRQAGQFQKGKDLSKFVSVVVLDEVGLAEDSPRMPLKTLHPLLETGSEEDEEIPAPYKKVAFVGLSNWALDPAKMNRGILVSREEPDIYELVETARGICATDHIVLKLIEPLIESLAKAYFTLYKEQDRQYFGLRDYYSLIKMVYQFSKKSMRRPSWLEIVHSVRRNFGGLPNTRDPVQVFEKYLGTMAYSEPSPDDPDCRPSGLLKASIEGHASGHGESRYLLILTEKYAALPIVQQQLLRQQDAITIFGSSFPYDQEYTQVCRNINRVKVCMETGRTVVLLNLENLYESLYDALNQYYVYFGDQRYVDLGLGTHRVKCRVHKDFRLIVIADKDVVYERFPTPLINRLEKHFLATSTMLTMDQQEILKQLEKWVYDFVSISHAVHRVSNYTFKVSDAFVGYHEDTLASLVFQVCNKMEQTEGDEDWKELVCEEVKNLLLLCATPDSVMRLANSKLLQEAQKRVDQYFSQEDTSCLASYLLHQINQTDGGTDTRDVMTQVTTHSRLLFGKEFIQLQETLGVPVQPLFLQNFQTEQQFCAEIRSFFTKCRQNNGLLLVQCEEGQVNNQLIACASYCIQDGKLQAIEETTQDGIEPLKSAHVVFVIQLSCGGNGYTGFQGTGTWSSVHINDLQPAQSNRPEIARLRGLGVQSLFERDPEVQAVLKSERSIAMEIDTDPVDTRVPDDETEDGTGMEIDQSEEEDKPHDMDIDPVVEANQHTFAHTTPMDQTSNGDSLSESSHPEDNEVIGNDLDNVIDVTRLLIDSLHTAAARISDIDENLERKTKRIALLIELMTTEKKDQQTDFKNFLLVIKLRLNQLLAERQERSMGVADLWLSNEALEVGDVQKSGTFRKAVWQRLIATLSPLFAELIAYCDYNNNLDILKYPPGHWKHQLWLAILGNQQISPIHYDEFLSPTHHALREKATVKMLGSGDRPMTTQIPFSWLLKDHLTVMYTQALELKANTNKSLEEIYLNLVAESAWGQILKQIIPLEACQVFMQNYMMDFINMTYKTNFNKENLERELECVFQAIDITLHVLARKLDMHQYVNDVTQALVALHMAYTLIQGRLAHFGRLIEIHPPLLDEANLERLARQEGEMTLDLTATRVVIESLEPDSKKWKDPTYQKNWFLRMNASKAVIENILNTAVNGSKDVYGETSMNIVHGLRLMWEKCCVLRLFVEHVCPPNVNVEESLSSQASMLWQYLKNMKNGMKTIEGIKAVENVLRVCSTRASKMHFKKGIDDCPICNKAIQDPIELSCGHMCCKLCIPKWFDNTNSRSCPVCQTVIPTNYKLEVTTEKREALEKYHAFRQRCNNFFMDVVSQLCFADGTPPDTEVVERLLTFVTRQVEVTKDQSIQTKRLTAFQGDGIDPSPVIRSVLLQLLLQANFDQVKNHIDQYLEQAQRVLRHSPEDIVDVCVLFVHCLEDSFQRQASRHPNPQVSQIEMATARLQAARTWLESSDVSRGLTLVESLIGMAKNWLSSKIPGDGLSVQYLVAIANARFGLVVTAQCLNAVYCQQDNFQNDIAANRAARELIGQAQLFLVNKSNHEAHLFLVRQLCHCYGTSTMEIPTQHQDMEWIKPIELRAQNEETPDRYIICSEMYSNYRETFAQALVQALLTEEMTDITKYLNKFGQVPSNQREASWLLALFRVITMTYSKADQHITAKVKQQAIAFVQKNSSVSQKDLAVHMINNHQGSPCNQMMITPGQGTLHQSLVCMVMHLVVCLQCTPTNPLLQPLVNILNNAGRMQGSFLPTMPGDYKMEIRNALANLKWYQCRNGHYYTIGECGRPYQQRQCIECGEQIGGVSHNLVAGSKLATINDNTTSKHTLGNAHGRSGRATPERNLSANVWTILRAILHTTMLGASINNAHAVQQLIRPVPPNVCEFLWQHLLKDLEQLAKSCGKSQDDCLLILHVVLQGITSIHPGGQGQWDELLSTKEYRATWEAAFAGAFISPVIQNLDYNLARANQAMQSDTRFSASALMQILYEPETARTVTAEDLGNLLGVSAMWQYRSQVTIESLSQYLQRQHGVRDGKDSFALLNQILDKGYILSVLHHLPDLIHLQQLLIDQFHRRIDAAEATNISIQDFLARSSEEFGYLVGLFITVWNRLREDIPKYGGITVPRELCTRVMNETNSLAMLLPTRKEAGVCSTALVDYLIATHNDFIDFYHGLTGEKMGGDPIPPNEATVSHLVAYDKDKDLLPLVLAHHDYAVEAGKGRTHTYNLQGLQKQVEDKFVRGRPKIVQKIERLVFRQDSRDATVFQILRNKITQKSLTSAIQHQIITELRSFPDLSDCLAALDIAIGFMVSSTNLPSMYIREYLHNTLSLPVDRGLQTSAKAHGYCRLRHILALWQTLAVERARRQMEIGQDPFDEIAPDFREELDEEQKEILHDSFKYINVDQLIAELYEYIVLNLKRTGNRELNVAEWGIVDVLDAYIDDKYGSEADNFQIRGLQDRFPSQLQMKHAVRTWNAAVKYTQEQPQQARNATMAHH